MKNPQGRNFKTVIFNHEDKAYKYTFKVIAPEFWESFGTDNVKFDIHYCEDNNDIIVYEIEGYNFDFPITDFVRKMFIVHKRQIK